MNNAIPHYIHQKIENPVLDHRYRVCQSNVNPSGATYFKVFGFSAGRAYNIG